MTPERKAYERHMTQFATRLSDGALVYDVGSGGGSYAEKFPRQKFIRIDKMPKAKPDIVGDIETGDFPGRIICTGDAVLCNGVIETVLDYRKFVKNVVGLLKKGGVVLFGIRSIGYPLSEHHDYVRLTPEGAKWMVGEWFKIVEVDQVMRGDLPSYVFVIGVAH
jgi:SAM-dependent methyltransferase